MTKATIQNVSDTALWVAAHRAKESERPDALYRDPLAARLAGERGLELAREMPYSAVLSWIMAVRTVAIDRLILKALTEGADAVINLGAGLDTRPYRMPLPKTLRWVELDFPHLIDLKNEKLAGETPRCDLTRIGIDLSEGAAATKLYAELGAKCSKALVVTEGVIPYLTNDQAGQLAKDLRAVESFKFWILDYRKSGSNWRHPVKLQKKLQNAPFRFAHPDPLAFFAERGWTPHEIVLAIEEGERHGRRFPVPFPWSWLVRFLPEARWHQFREGMGYALLRA